MKTVLKLITAFALLLAVSAVNAQVRDTAGRNYSNPPIEHLFNPATDPTPNPDYSSQEYVTISGRTTLLFKNGNSSTLNYLYTCTDGSVVTADGIMTDKNGGTMKLKEGDKVYKDGHVVKASQKKNTPNKNDMDSPDK